MIVREGGRLISKIKIPMQELEPKVCVWGGGGLVRTARGGIITRFYGVYIYI